jgi:hypothetical protein
VISRVFVFLSLQLGFVVQNISIMFKNEVIIVGSVGGVGEVATCDVNMNPASSLSNVENVHLQCGSNLLENDDVNLQL